MIKKIIGTLFALGTVAVMVATALNAGNYESMLPNDFFGGFTKDVPTGEAAAEPTIIENQADTTVEQILTDSLTIE